jgi:hypothetical protein
MDSFTPPSPLPVSACGEEERKEVPTDMYPGHKTLNPCAGVKLVVCEVATAHAWRSPDDADVDAPLQPPRHVHATASQLMASIIPTQIHVPN